MSKSVWCPRKRAVHVHTSPNPKLPLLVGGPVPLLGTAERPDFIACTRLQGRLTRTRRCALHRLADLRRRLSTVLKYAAQPCRTARELPSTKALPIWTRLSIGRPIHNARIICLSGQLSKNNADWDKSWVLGLAFNPLGTIFNGERLKNGGIMGRPRATARQQWKNWNWENGEGNAKRSTIESHISTVMQA